MTTPDYSKGNEKIVFHLFHAADVDLDSTSDGYIVIHLTVTLEIRNELISALNHLNMMRKEGIINSFIQLRIPCTVYYQTIAQVGNTQAMCRTGFQVDEFPVISEDEYENRWDDADLLIGLPLAGHTNSMSVSIYFNRLSERYETASEFLSGIAQKIYDTMLT
ncbi:MAG: hypothetical protein KKC20_24955 [Proteobacteria bacterium]|jgi:hypothetical protein|nr:hypothetical protein [Pseudomonadota bacterium]